MTTSNTTQSLDLGIEPAEALDAPSDAGDLAVGIGVGIAVGVIVVLFFT
jgi:hypothetical protein